MHWIQPSKCKVTTNKKYVGTECPCILWKQLLFSTYWSRCITEPNPVGNNWIPFSKFYFASNWFPPATWRKIPNHHRRMSPLPHQFSSRILFKHGQLHQGPLIALSLAARSKWILLFISSWHSVNIYELDKFQRSCSCLCNLWLIQTAVHSDCSNAFRPIWNSWRFVYVILKCIFVWFLL